MERVRYALNENMSVSQDKFSSQLTSTAIELGKKALSVAFKMSRVRLAHIEEPFVFEVLISVLGVSSDHLDLHSCTS